MGVNSRHQVTHHTRDGGIINIITMNTCIALALLCCLLGPSLALDCWSTRTTASQEVEFKAMRDTNVINMETCNSTHQTSCFKRWYKVVGWGDYYYALGLCPCRCGGGREYEGSQRQGRIILLHRRLLQLKWSNGGPHGTDSHGCPGQLDEIMINDKPTFLPQTTRTLFAISEHVL